MVSGRTRVRAAGILALLGLMLAACDGDRTASPPEPARVGSSTSTSVAEGSTTTSTTIAPTTPSVPVVSPTSSPVSPSSTTLPQSGTMPRTVEVGRSVEGRAITAIRRGRPGGMVVLIVGVIHGDEDAGVAIVDDLLDMDVPAGIDLWIVRSMNPDGQAHRDRRNANGVDLNRNFPYRWAPLAQRGDWEYGGPSAASEPETKAMVTFIDQIHPALTIWYHQDLYRIDPASGRPGRVRARYAQLTGLPQLPVTGGVYTGTASPHVQATVTGSISFIVELGTTLSAAEARTHAKAVLTVASELPAI
jgi:protein MpaA